MMRRNELPQFALTSGPRAVGSRTQAAAKPWLRHAGAALLAAVPMAMLLPLPTASAAQVQQQPATTNPPTIYPQHGYFPPHGHAPMAPGQRPYPDSNPAAANRGVPNASMPRPNAVTNPGAAAMPAPAPQAASAGLPPSVLDQPAQAATVDLAGGKLTVHADNSSLTAIMNQVAASAGMKIDGLTRDERVFGTYGPGEPHEIISELLDGSGYNVVMFGKTTSGTPSEITLTPRGGPASSGTSNGMRGAARPTQPAEDEDDSAQQQTQYQDQPQQQPPPQPGPGAVSPGAPPKTPQQMLQELQQMREQQQQQQQQQQPQ